MDRAEELIEQIAAQMYWDDERQDPGPDAEFIPWSQQDDGCKAMYRSLVRSLSRWAPEWAELDALLSGKRQSNGH
jgi:hypothetical protein